MGQQPRISGGLKMKSKPIDERMSQIAERDMQEVYKEFVKKNMEWHRRKQEREQKKRDAEASNAETVRQPVENPA